MGQDDKRVRRIKQYVLGRLKEELANAPRGAQARLAKRLDVSGAHLSNMLSSTPTRQPGEDFRRKVASHWGVSYAQLEALAWGEEPPVTSTGSSSRPPRDTMPPNLTVAVGEYAWMHELPHELRVIVREQARQHYVFTRRDLPREEWHRIVTGLEREALALIAYREEMDSEPPTGERERDRAGNESRKRRARS